MADFIKSLEEKKQNDVLTFKIYILSTFFWQHKLCLLLNMIDLMQKNWEWGEFQPGGQFGEQ